MKLADIVITLLHFITGLSDSDVVIFRNIVASWVCLSALIQKSKPLDDASKQAFKLKFFGEVKKIVEDCHFARIFLDSRIYYTGLSPYVTRKVEGFLLAVATKLIRDLNSDKRSKSMKKLSAYHCNRDIFECDDRNGDVGISWNKAYIAKLVNFGINSVITFWALLR